MKRIISLLCLVGIFLMACSGPSSFIPSNRPISPAMQAVTSVTDPVNCKFVRSLYIEVLASSLNYYVAYNTEKFGGDSYKIINVSSEKSFGGINIVMVNFEIYKCTGINRKEVK